MSDDMPKKNRDEKPEPSAASALDEALGLDDGEDTPAGEPIEREPVESSDAGWDELAAQGSEPREQEEPSVDRVLVVEQPEAHLETEAPLKTEALADELDRSEAELADEASSGEQGMKSNVEERVDGAAVRAEFIDDTGSEPVDVVEQETVGADGDKTPKRYDEHTPVPRQGEGTNRHDEEELEHDKEGHIKSPTPGVVGDHDKDHPDGLAAYFDDPHELLHAAEMARDEGFEVWDAFSPFPIHGIEDAMGVGRSWLPWVTFGAGGTGFLLANAMQFGMLTFDWPMIIGGKPYAPWPSFVPIMFELTVLIGGVTTALVMFIASGCFRKPKIIDPEITNDRFVLWIDAQDPKYDIARTFMAGLNPVEIRDVTF